ncbi:MAG TPA: pitrilysin family protein [Myxococcales bacterium]|nr:pitrilysin family protein [Myxococcales bacterium]
MLVSLLAALVAAAPAAPAATKAFPFPIEVHALPNGLRVALVQYDSPGLVAYYTLMRVGSRNEVEKGRSGYAHFFEHMMFRGTRQHPARDYNDTVTRLGLNTNAFTSEDMTVYHLYGPAKALPTIIEYEADRFQNLDYDEPAFRTEAGAILGEYVKSASNPEQKLYEKMMETAFTRHTYAHTVIGYLKDIENMPGGYQYSREFFRRYYTPDDAIIFVAGDFDKAATLRAIEKAYGSWKGKADPVKVPQEPRQHQSKRAQVSWDKPTLPRLWIAWHTPGASDIKSAAVQNLLNAYLFGPTSPLYQNLVLGKQLVDSMEPTYSDHRDPNLFGVLLRVKDAKNLKAVEHAILLEIKSLAGGKLDPKRFEAVRSNLRYSNIMGLDTADAAALSEAVNAALTGDVNYLNKEFDALAQLQPKDLQNFAKSHFIDLNRTTVTLTSASKGGAR